MVKKIYVAATGQHNGKTTCTLGIVSALKGKGINVGYCKPVGQEAIKTKGFMIDKDALLFSEVIDFELEDSLHSPVIVGRKTTQEYIDNPELFDFSTRIDIAQNRLEKLHDYIVYEGTGHVGVGSIIDLSNADVAKMLGAKVVMVAEGGIGNTFDRLNLNLGLFREANVPVIGVIINKVLPEKIPKIRHYIEKRLQNLNIPLLGVIPFDKSLSNPIMETIREAVDGITLVNQHALNNKISHIISGAMLERDAPLQSDDTLLIVNYLRLESAINTLQNKMTEKQIKQNPIKGIILHGESEVSQDFLQKTSCFDFINKHEIPIISTMLDTYGSAVKINQIEVKINIRTPWKARRAIELIEEHLDIKHLLNT